MVMDTASSCTGTKNGNPAVVSMKLFDVIIYPFKRHYLVLEQEVSWCCVVSCTEQSYYEQRSFMKAIYN